MTEDGKEQVIQILHDTMAKGLTQILINPKTPNVQLPLKLLQQDSLVLNLSWRFDGANNVFGPEAFQATLTFDGAPFRVSLPWDCFIAILPFPQPETAAERRSKFKVV